ncbi:MAG: DUF349 domain-containing protein [Vicinamibacteria bacterium]|nr:DUF349 domain-containing protein [Vicinamibacteria bacterium]
MALIDIFKAKPRWLQGDPAVRAEAVRDIDVSDQALLATIAQSDGDARVRRSAARKLQDVPILVEIIARDMDESVRAEARLALLASSLSDGDAAASEAALAALDDQKLLATAAKSARLESVRARALARLTDSKAIAGVSREAAYPSARLAALSRLDDAALLLNVAMSSDQKDVALAALDRLHDRDALKTVAGRARCKAAQRRARVLLGSQAAGAALGPHERRSRQSRLCQRLEALLRAHSWESAESELAEIENAWAELAPAHDEATSRRFSIGLKALRAGIERYHEERLQNEREVASRENLRSHEELCAQVETESGDAAAARIEAARAAWDALGPLMSPDADALTARFERALKALHDRSSAKPSIPDLGAQAMDLLEEAESVAAREDLVEARRRFGDIERRWRDLASAADAEMAARMEQARRRIEERNSAAREERQKREHENRTRIEELCARIERLMEVEAPALRDAERSLREARAALEDIGPLPSRKDRESLTARLEKARRRLYPRVQELRQDHEWKRWANVNAQERLCKSVEALLDRQDMDEVARELREIDVAWRQAREVPREQGASFRERFQEARRQLRERCDAHFARLAEAHAENVKKSEDLCERAQALAESVDWARAGKELRKLQEEWKSLGPVPPKVSRALWARFRAPCDRFYARLKEHRSQQAAEWRENLGRKEALCERAETLSQSSDWEPAAAEIKSLQTEWRNIGAVKRTRSDAVWKRFRQACDTFFERYKNRNVLDQESNLARRESLLSELEDLRSASGESLPGQEIARRVVEIQTAWRQCGYLPRQVAQPLEERFAQTRREIVLAHPESFAGTDLDPEASRRKAAKICGRVESLIEELSPTLAEGDIARQIQSALAANAMGSRSDREERWRTAVPEVENAQANWRRLGPVVPRETEQDLAQRFERACARFFKMKPKTRSSGPERPASR